MRLSDGITDVPVINYLSRSNCFFFVANQTSRLHLHQILSTGRANMLGKGINSIICDARIFGDNSQVFGCLGDDQR